MNEYFDNITDYFTPELKEASLHEQVRFALSQVVFLPKPELYLPLLSAVSLCSVKGSKILPRIFSYGLKGSGKSEVAKFIARLRNQKLLSSKTTYAGLRNIINESKWYAMGLEDVEDNAKEGSFLCWDNLREDSLEQDINTYQLLLAGYNRATAVIQISSAIPGANMSFDCFCPCIFSSVFPLHINLAFDELHRRMLVVPHKPYESLSLEERARNEAISGLPSVYDRLQLDDCDLSYLTDKYYAFWDEARLTELQQRRMELKQRAKDKSSLLRQANAAFLTLMLDTLANGLVLEVFSTTLEAEEYFLQLWHHQQELKQVAESATELLVKAFILEETSLQRQTNELLISAGMSPAKLQVDATKLKRYLELLAQDGRLDKQVRVRERNQIMASLGYKLDAKCWIEI